MTTHFNAAAAAYNSTARLLANSARPQADQVAGSSEGQKDFAKVLAESVQSVVEAGKASEQLSMGLVNGSADIVDVVTAVSQTEIAMQTMVTVRDRVISAYEEILRMPI